MIYSVIAAELRSAQKSLEADASARARLPLRPHRLEFARPRTSFTRGQESPRGVVWFGVRSFWGHLQHLLASAIATEDVDSRDWMTPDEPSQLAAHVAEILGGDGAKGTVLEALGRELWIDYVSDTGDDVAVSRAVARLIFASYSLPDPENPERELLAPRGDMLLFGGDIAYPVATAQEITNRVLVPFNQVLAEVDDGRPRVMLAIPGNHDWYDGLDGFGRMFRRRGAGQEEDLRPSVVGVSHRMLEHYAEWTREFVRGGKVEKPKALVLRGYTPVQSASYFVLPLTSHIHLFGVDRQLRTIDSRQRRFLSEWYSEHPEVNPWILLPDPVYQFGEPSRTGTQMVQALGLDFAARSHFLLAGDIHHYQRLEFDRVLSVTAGGGGAFLHPAPLGRPKRLIPKMQWPDAAQSRVLLRQVPLKVATGRSGFLPHFIMLALFLPAMKVGIDLYEKLGYILSAPIAITLVTSTTYALIGGVRRRGFPVFGLALCAGALTALIPIAASVLLKLIFERMALHPSVWIVAGLTLLSAVFFGALIFGGYLSLLTWLGYEQTQAFTALDHPGFKHFVRLRVRADGSAIDGFCIGLVDPLAADAAPVLVDTLSFRPEAE